MVCSYTVQELGRTGIVTVPSAVRVDVVRDSGGKPLSDKHLSAASWDTTGHNKKLLAEVSHKVRRGAARHDPLG